MPRIKTEELLDTIAAGDFQAVKLKGLQGGAFYMLLENSRGAFIHENSDGSVKEYPQVDHALTWLKRMCAVKEVIVDIALWRNDA